jgi:hypothetical protein
MCYAMLCHRYQDAGRGVIFGSMQHCRWRCAEISAWPEEDVFLDPAAVIGTAVDLAAFLARVLLGVGALFQAS